MTEAGTPKRYATGKESPGEFLRQLREAQGHTHSSVGEALHLTAHYIKALESDEYGKLPGLTFVKGYLRAYARFLRADVDAVIALFDNHVAGLIDEGASERVQLSRRRQDQALRWGIGAACVVIAGIASGWWLMRDAEPAPAPVANRLAAPLVVATAARQPEVSVAPAVTLPEPLPEVEPAPASVANATPLLAVGLAPPDLAPEAMALPEEATLAAEDATPSSTVTAVAGGARHVALLSSGSDELAVQFNGNSWIEVDDASRVRLFSDILHAGDSLAIRGSAPFHVLIGDATQVQVMVNAQAVDLTDEIRDDNTARIVLGAADVLVRSELAPNEDGALDESGSATGAQD